MKPYLWLIQFIGVIVPRRLRADWRQEWEAELRYREALMSEWENLNWRNKLDLLRRSVGAFWDALWLQPRRLEDEMFQDLRFGARMLLRQRAFTAAAVIALGLGIGANTAVFSVVNSVLLRPLPYSNSDRMALVWGNFLKFGMEQTRAKAAEYVDYRDQTRSFETVAAFNTEDFNFTGGQQPDRIAGASVTANLFSMLGAQAEQGRLILPEENQPGRNRDQPVTVIKTMNEVIASTTAPRRFNTFLLAIFSAVAVTLAAVGVYSVISFSVTQRTREIGLRMALGAQSGDAIRLILKQGLTLTLIGVAAGLIGAVAAARAISGMLYGVTATDPATFALVSILLAAVALLACYLPARRAAKVAPIIALRHE